MSAKRRESTELVVNAAGRRVPAAGERSAGETVRRSRSRRTGRAQTRASDPLGRRLPGGRGQAGAGPEDRAAEVRPARWHDDLHAPSPAKRRSGRGGGPAGGGRARGQRPDVVSQRVVPLSRAGGRPDEPGRRSSHRGIDERTARRLLLARPHAGPRGASIARGALAGDPGRRGPHRHRRHRGPDRRSVRKRGRLARAVGLRVARVRPRRLPVRRPCHRGHRQPGPLPLHPVADPGQQRGLRGGGRLDRRSGARSSRAPPWSRRAPIGCSSPSTSPASCATPGSSGTGSRSRPAPAASHWRSSSTSGR